MHADVPKPEVTRRLEMSLHVCSKATGGENTGRKLDDECMVVGGAIILVLPLSHAFKTSRGEMKTLEGGKATIIHWGKR